MFNMPSQDSVLLKSVRCVYFWECICAWLCILLPYHDYQETLGELFSILVFVGFGWVLCHITAHRERDIKDDLGVFTPQWSHWNLCLLKLQLRGGRSNWLYQFVYLLSSFMKSSFSFPSISTLLTSLIPSLSLNPYIHPSILLYKDDPWPEAGWLILSVIDSSLMNVCACMYVGLYVCLPYIDSQGFVEATGVLTWSQFALPQWCTG